MCFLGYSNTSLKWMPYLYLKFDSIFKVSKYWTQSKNSMWIFWFFISIKNQEKPPDVLYFRLCICVYFFIGLDCYSLPDKHWSYCPWKHRQCVVWALQCLRSCSWLDLQLCVGSTYKSIWEAPDHTPISTSYKASPTLITIQWRNVDRTSKQYHKESFKGCLVLVCRQFIIWINSYCQAQIRYVNPINNWYHDH